MNSKILISESNSLESEKLSRILKNNGFNVVGIAKDQAEAIEMARSLHPDIIISDAKTLESANEKSIPATQELNRLNQALQEEILKNKNIEHALKESEQLLKSALEYTDSIITIQDIEGKYTYFNSPGTFNIRYNKVIGKTPFDFFEPHYAEDIMTHFKQVVATGKAVESENEMVWQGASLWLFDQSSPIIDSDGKLTGVITFSQNITERKKNDAMILKIQKLESVGALAGGIAHEFNNIMTGIFGNISIAKEQLVKGHPSLKFLEYAERSMNRSVQLTKKLLTFAKGEAPIKEITDMGMLIEETVRLDLVGSNVKPVFDKQDDLWAVEVDRGQIKQAFSNLTVNADQAMPDGGRLFIKLSNVNISENTIPNLKKGKYVKITMRDEGIGIPRKYFDKIFDPYFSTKQTGSGLGLAAVFSIINKHCGNISLDSETNNGAVFTIYIPALDSPPNVIIKSEKKTEKIRPEVKNSQVKNTGETNLKHSKPQYNAKVLVMDDEEMILIIISKILKSIGIVVETAVNGEEAIDIYKKAIDDKKPFDVVIMDLIIPNGMGGKEAIKKILEIDPKAKVIVSSGYSIDSVMAHYQDYGFKGVIAKPYTLNKLQNIIIKVLSM